VHLAVNGRAVRDAGLVRAAEAAYRTTIPDGLRPSLYLEVEVAADAVDVNVHPAKAEVRFRDRWPLERVVEMAVRRALGTVDAGASLGRSYWPVGGSNTGSANAGMETLRSTIPPAPFFSIPDVAPPGYAEGGGETTPPVGEIEDVPPLLQLRRTYIMFERMDGLVLIDQHSAHERVLFERFMYTLERGDTPGQRLLFPMTLHLSAQEAEAFDDARPGLETLGFEIEGFGGNTLIVRSVPMPHPRFDAERCLRETLAALAGDRGAATHTRHERLAATIACKAAIKAGEMLSHAEMCSLFVSLRDTSLPAHDVHGRATIVHLTWDEIERRFGRK
jgi:DNA mismatch repair protein MutL